MHQLTTTTGIVALAAGGVAVVAFLLALVLAFKLRRVRQSQKAVLGPNGTRRDLVDHAARIEQGFADLRELVDDTMASLEQTLGHMHRRLDGCVAYTGLVRYDAYNELSGQQSSSLALLDTHRSGVVISSILHREQARVYVKRIHEGQSELELSPEEHEAIDTALEAPAPRAAQQVSA